MWQCSLFDAYFKAQVLYYVGFGFLRGLGGQVCVDVHLLMHILKFKFYIFVGFGFLEGLGCHMCANVDLVMHILKPKCHIFWVWIFEDGRGQLHLEP